MAAQDNLSKQQFSGVVSSAAKKHIAWCSEHGQVGWDHTHEGHQTIVRSSKEVAGREH